MIQCEADNSCFVFSFQDGQHVKTLTHHKGLVQSVAFSFNGKYVVLTVYRMSLLFFCGRRSPLLTQWSHRFCYLRSDSCESPERVLYANTVSAPVAAHLCA